MAGRRRDRGGQECPPRTCRNRAVLLLVILAGESWAGAARFVPEGEFHAIPEAEFVVDDAQVVFHHMFGSADGIRHFTVLQALCDKLDDLLLTFTGDTASITLNCMHDCLRYKSVASLTRLMPSLIPKRRNNRLK